MDSLNVDHFVPKDAGGRNEIENLVPSCRSCNSKKKNRTLGHLREIMSRVESYINFSAQQKRWVIENTGVDLDEHLHTKEPYQFWFEKHEAQR